MFFNEYLKQKKCHFHAKVTLYIVIFSAISYKKTFISYCTPAMT